MKIRLTFYIILFLLLSGGAGTIYLQQRKINKLASDNDELITFAHDSSRIATTYINSYNQVVSKNKVLELSDRNLRKLMDTKDLAHLKQLESVKRNGKNLYSALRIDAIAIQNIKVRTSDSTVIADRSGDAIPDTLVGRSFSYHDQFNSISGISFNDSTSLHASIQVPLSGAVTWKRKHKFIFKNWRFGKKEYFSELTSENPWVTITNHEFIKVHKR